jgi:hypothetical protein
MRMGDYHVAARCFEDVIERYREHAFAHYFLAKAYEKIGGKDEKVTENLTRFNTIIANSDTWKGHADHFGLTGKPRFLGAANVNFAPSDDTALVSSAV